MNPSRYEPAFYARVAQSITSPEHCLMLLTPYSSVILFVLSHERPATCTCRPHTPKHCSVSMALPWLPSPPAKPWNARFLGSRCKSLAQHGASPVGFFFFFVWPAYLYQGQDASMGTR